MVGVLVRIFGEGFTRSFLVTNCRL
uniref:Uncharacterized protein n=1 Tax=Arundo donax TaxID=35708 RepID=A0A0A9B008_ARUDO